VTAPFGNKVKPGPPPPPPPPPPRPEIPIQLLSPAKHVEDMPLHEFVTPNSALCMDVCSTLSIHQRLRQGQAANGQRAVVTHLSLGSTPQPHKPGAAKHSQLDPAGSGGGGADGNSSCHITGGVCPVYRSASWLSGLDLHMA
jgi:hypothetical protein